jgi:hypothetical protein
MQTDYKDKLIARLLANTKTRKRPNNIIEIAADIDKLVQILGSLNIVSETVGVSNQMLRKFLCVNSIAPEIKKMVQSRAIDKVAIIDILKRFKKEDQKIIAKEIIKGNLNVDNMKVLSALYSKSVEQDIRRLIVRVRESENKKIYVIRFKIDSKTPEFKIIKNNIEKIVGAANLISFRIDKDIGIIELNKNGRTKLSKSAKVKRQSLREFIRNLLGE